MPDGVGGQPSALPLPLVNRARPALVGASGQRSSYVRWLVAGLFALALAGVIAGLLLGRAPRPETVAPRLPEGNVAVGPAADAVLGLGRLVPRGRVVAVAAPFGAGDARIDELLVTEGQRVAAGAVLAVLDGEPSLRAAVASAEATVGLREAGLVQARVQAMSSRDEARAALSRTEAAITANRRDLDRATDLASRGASTPQVVDQRRMALAGAEADAATARAALLRYDIPDLERQADVAVARAAFAAAVADLERARADLGRATVRAPFAGMVLTLLARPGERPGDGGLMTFGALDDMIAEVEIYENHIGRLREGMAGTLTAPALAAPLVGWVSRIGAEVLRQTLTDTSPAANTDSRVVRITLDLDPASAAAAARLPNLQVIARIGAVVKR